VKIALFSGGKDSFYASVKEGSFDAYLILVYEFPNPSPHLINLGPSVMTGLLTSRPVLVKKLTKGREFNETVEFLREIGATTIIAGDVYVEEHLRYMERVAEEAGAKLKEPLWGLDPLEVLVEEVEYGIEARIIGVIHGLEPLLGLKLSRETYHRVVEEAVKRGFDVLGEKGEYHTIVEYSPRHLGRLEYRIAGERESRRGKFLELVLREYRVNTRIE